VKYSGKFLGKGADTEGNGTWIFTPAEPMLTSISGGIRAKKIPHYMAFKATD
jgi:hypothetical protein